MAEITSLTSVLKGGLDLNDYFVVANKNTKRARKLSAKSMFPAITTSGTGGESLWSSITNNNQINLKGLKSADTTKITIATTSDNLVITLLEAGIDLSKCDNTTSAFLTSVDLSTATNTLGVTKGGTGLTSIVKGSVLYGSATNTISSTQFVSNGQLLIGNATTGVPQLGTLASSDSSITITNTAGAIDLKAAATSSLNSNLDASTYNINLNSSAGTSFVSGDGTNEGVTIDDSGRVFVGDGTPTVPSLDSQLTLGGSTTKALVIGNTNSYKAHTVEFKEASGTTAGLAGTIKGAQGGSGGAAGGNLTIAAGASVGSNAGGNLYLDGGDYASGGSGGGVSIRTNSSHSAQTEYLSIAAGGATTMRGATTITGTLTTSSTITANSHIYANAGISQAAPVLLSDANTAITLSSHGGRTVIIPDISDNRTFTMPDPAAAGEYYRLLYFGTGAAADGHNVTIQGVNNDNTTGFYGAVVHHDTNQTSQTSSIVWGSATDDNIVLASGQAFDLHFLATSTTQYYIWGWSAGDTIITIS
tara:strand:- start:601 stop:2196 length:1596 start_codon:yes stop_codon:yes gene_type:complete